MDFRVESLKAFKDVEVHAYTTHVSKMIASRHCRQLPAGLLSYNPLKRIAAWWNYIKILRKELQWADVIHWYWDFNYIPILRIPIEYYFVRQSGKKGLIMWCGSEIRNPETDMKINPYYKKEKESGSYEYSFESAIRSKRTQKLFHSLGFIPLEFIGIGHYIDKTLFPERFRVFQVIGISQYQPFYPDVQNTKPLIVHSASKTGGKGTKYVIEAISELQKQYSFDFKLIHNLTKQDALDLVSRCDIFVDQLITGSHGTAAVEAMAMGKPVICYINETIGADYPEDLPLHNANPDTIYEVLKTLISSAELRLESGKKSRAYAEKYHDDAFNAKALYASYQMVIKFNISAAMD